MAKIQKILSLDLETFEHIKCNPLIPNFSRWVEERYVAEFMSLEHELTRLDTSLKIVEATRARIKIIKSLNKAPNLRADARRWLHKVAPSRIARSTIQGVLRFFNCKFELDLSMRQFKIYLKHGDEK